jgi:Fanconi anemia group M protein
MTKIIVDTREKEIIQEFEKQDIPYKKEQLVIADFVIGDIAIERKTQNDFINSIIDKRILNQLIEIKNHFEVPLLIIEGDKNIYTIRDFHPNAIRGMFAAITIDYQIPVIFTKNHRDTVAFLKVILNRIEKGHRAISLLKKKKPLTIREHQEYIIQALPGIGSTLAKNILKKFSTVKNIINASEDNLKKVEKLGPKKIKEIKKVIEEGYQ